MKKNSLPALTSLRFFAAMTIIAFHFSINNAAMIPSYLYHIIKQGDIAVNFFFVLSGFVLAYTYLDQAIDKKRFWVARFARIYPVYLLALLLSLPAYLSTLDATTGTPIVRAITSLLAELTLLQAWFPIDSCGINCPGWSISAEIFFYVLFPWIGVYLTRFRTRSLWMVACCLWIAAIAINTPLWLTYSAMSAGASRKMFGDFMAFSPLLNLFGFMIGVATGITFLRHGHTNATKLPAYQVTWLEIGALGLALVIIAYSGIPHALLRNSVASPLFAAIIYTLALGKGKVAKLLSHPRLMILGEASYAIYILQVPISDWIRLLIKVTPLQHLGGIAYPLLYMPAIMGFSLLSFYLLEKPIRGKIIALFQNNSTRTSPYGVPQGLSNQGGAYAKLVRQDSIM